jgi:hypothetical protein
MTVYYLVQCLDTSHVQEYEYWQRHIFDSTELMADFLATSLLLSHRQT